LNADEHPYDGVGEVYFDDIDDMRDAFDNDVGEEIRADEENFIDDIVILPAAETVQYDRR
jgi:uncharacterized protein (TIGR02118 family)